MQLNRSEITRYLKAGIEASLAHGGYPRKIKELEIIDSWYDEDGNLKELEVDIVYKPFDKQEAA